MSNFNNELKSIDLSDGAKIDFDVNEANDLINLLCAVPFIKSVLSLFATNANLNTLRLEYETRSEYDDNNTYESSVIHRVVAKDEHDNNMRYLRHEQNILDLDLGETHEEYRLDDCSDLSEELGELAQGCNWIFGVEANDSPLSNSYASDDEIQALFGPFQSITLTREAVTPFLQGGYTLGDLSEMLSKQNSYKGISNNTRID